MPIQRTRRVFAVLTTLIGLAGCTVGPKYERPGPADSIPGAYKENQKASADTRAAGWRPAVPRDESHRGNWWEVFGDSELNQLEAKLNINNQNIKQYFENYMASLAVVRNSRASLYPTLTLNPSASVTGPLKSRSSQVTTTGTSTAGTGVANTTVTTSSFGSSSQTTESYSVPLAASWEPDLFGRIRNTIRGNANAAQVSAANLANEILSEQSSLAQYYFQLRGQDSLQDLYDRTVASYRESLRLSQAQFRTGMSTQQDVAQAELNLRTAEANASAVATTRAQYEHAIAVLVGQTASSFSVPRRSLASKPPHIPAGIPSKLLERRPDIAAAERTMAQANAQIGVGKAAYYPDITLTGALTQQSSSVNNLFNFSNGVWSLGSTAAQTLLSFGARRATVQQYEAQYNADVAAYRQTVLTAFKEVEDYLVANRQLAEQSKRQQLAVDAAQQYLKLADVRYKTGVDTYLNVITAQNSVLTTRQTLVTLDTNRMVSAVQLIASLGGDWDVSKLPSEPQMSRGVEHGSAPFNPF